MVQHVVSKECVFSGNRIHCVDVVVQTDSGKQYRRQIVEHPQAVVILPITDDGNIMLIRQFRLAAGEALLEVPAGVIDSQEQAIDGAQRELREETGYRAQELTPMFAAYPSPGFCTELMSFFSARGLVFDPLQPDEDEDIEIVEVTVDQALIDIRSGRIRDLKTIAAILSLQVLL